LGIVLIRLQVCKFPEKTKERKGALSTEEYISTQAARLEQDVSNNEDEAPVEPPPRLNLPGFRKASDISKKSLSPPREVEGTVEPRGPERASDTVGQNSVKSGLLMGGNIKRARVGLGTGQFTASRGNPTGGPRLNRAFKVPTFKVPAVPVGPIPPSSPPPITTSTSVKASERGSSEPDRIELSSSSDESDVVLIEDTKNRSPHPPKDLLVPNPVITVGETSSHVGSRTTNPLGTKPRNVFYPSGPQKEKRQDKPSSDGEAEDLHSIAKLISLARNGRSRTYYSCLTVTKSCSISLFTGSPSPNEETEIDAPYSNKVSVSGYMPSEARLTARLGHISKKIKNAYAECN
jgi:hypothetical protein